MESTITIEAVLFDRDGTLVVDVPYNGDPELVRPVEGAVECVKNLRAAGLKLGIVSNQSGIARGFITHEQVEAVNRRVQEIFGAFDVSLYCPHGPDDGCDCRKPMPGMILDAARLLDTKPAGIVVIGDKQSDVDAAHAAGARYYLIASASELRDACKEILRDLSR